VQHARQQRRQRTRAEFVIDEPSGHDRRRGTAAAEADGAVDKLWDHIEAIQRGRARIVAKRVGRSVQDHVAIAGRERHRLRGLFGGEPA